MSRPPADSDPQPLGDHAPAGGREGEGRRTPERYGPLAVERLTKDDGRALLLFVLEDQP